MENPGSFLRKLPDAKEILFACGIPADECLESASDYEFFRAFCRMQQRLSHNRLTLAAKALLAKNGCKEELSEKTVDPIWRYFANLLRMETPDESLFCQEEATDTPPLSIRSSDFISPEALVAQAKESATPDAFANALLDAFWKGRKTGLLVDLTDAFYQKQPSVYAVECALAGQADRSVLYLQAIRLFAQNRIPMLLFPHADGASAIAFFSRLESLVGIPELYLVVTNMNFSSALDFLLSPGKGIARPVLTKEELCGTASSLYYRYPMGNSYLLLQESCRKSCKNH